MPPNEGDTLERRLLAAHAADDHSELVRLYGLAANKAETENRIEAACFYLTQAYVYALEIGAPQAAHLHKRLLAYGREE